MRQLPTAAEAAILIAIAIKRKEAEAGKEFSRLRLSEKTLKLLTGRRRIDGRFVADLNEALFDHNLVLVVTSDAIGLLKASSIRGFPRMNSERVKGELKQARRGELDYDSLADELEDEISEFDVENDE